MNTVRLINRLFFGKKNGAFNPSEKDALLKALGSVVKRQKDNAHRFPALVDMRERLREVRNISVGSADLLDEALKNLRKNNFKVLLANGLDDAFAMLAGEIAGEKTVVKSKSNISKEMRLAARCAELGIEVVETDIGDRVLQLSKGRPSHPTGPVSHMSRHDIAAVLARELGKDVPPDAEAIIAAIRKDIVEAIGRSRIGVTGANAITAREGSVVIIHNEGNVSEVSRLPGKHIIIADTTKIYPTIEDAVSMVKLQTYSATGAVTTSYMNVISGVSKTADIEKKLFYGVHGPSEVVVILVKREEHGEEFRESSFCIGCGGCLPECPVYAELGSAFGSYHKQGGIGVVHSALGESMEEAVGNGLYSCTKCGSCTVNCPVSIDTPRLIGLLRERAVADTGLKKKVRPYRMLAASVVLAAGAKGAVKWSRGLSSGVAYFPGCISTVNAPNMRREITGLLEAMTGGPVNVIEGCCGGAWESFGFRKEYCETFDRLLHSIELSPPERIVVSCPHCYYVLWTQNGERLKKAGVGTVLRLTEMIKETSSATDYEGGEEKRIAFHDSCIFGRQMGVYDEPREALAMCGAEVVEMDRVRERSQCCGFPLLAQAPEAAASMAQRVADSAISAGADTLVSSGCPGCYYALKRATGIRVEDLSGFLYNKHKAVKKR